MRPFTPMSPILADTTPQGGEWVHQLKWDGYRIVARVDEGRAELFSKRMLPKNRQYPELAAVLSRKAGSFLLDGEAFVLDPDTGKPSFQLMQQRDKQTDPAAIRRSAAKHPVQYMIFDLLELDGADLRPLAYEERRRRLLALCADWRPPLYTADEFEDGEALWDWVRRREWEGMVSKKRASPYREGKEHRDWLKRKTALHFDVEIAGVIWKEGRVSSLVMRKDGRYFGRVSSGLTETAKAGLARLSDGGARSDYFPSLPEGLRNADVRWLRSPLEGRVTGRETTAQGLLRHPKLIDLGGIPL